MIVPQYWAEARLQQREKGRQVTVRRFGWSDVSRADAEVQARERARAALARIVAGEKLARREPRVAYNGAEGVPIREEILGRHDDVVITRNAYGAHCLNTPDVLFADVDFAIRPAPPLLLGAGSVLLTAAVALGIITHSFLVGCIAVLLALGFSFLVASHVQRAQERLRGGPEQSARRRIEAFVRRHPDWRVRLYRTPAGWRVLAMHALFVPSDAAVGEFFKAVGVDAVYGRMCRNQACFRARVSPKPWRIGIGDHMRPRPGVWPVNPERLHLRQRWIAAYEAKAAGFASCRFVAEFGSSVVHARAARVRELHDRLSQAVSGREIA